MDHGGSVHADQSGTRLQTGPRVQDDRSRHPRRATHDQDASLPTLLGPGVAWQGEGPELVRRGARCYPSGQMDPEVSTGLQLRPLLGRGERFPVEDPLLEPILEPRPVSDARFLQALLEGITAIEQQGWQRFLELGAPPIRRIITLGGGARNAQWRRLRQRVLGLPVLNRPNLSAARGMALLAQGKMEAISPKPAP